MSKNSLEKNFTSLPDEKPHRSSDGILEDVFEEIPEMDSVGRSGTWQNLLLPLAAVLVIILVPLLLSLTVFRKTDAPLARDFPYISLENVLLQNAVQEIETNRIELNEKDLTIRRYEDRIQTMDSNLQIMQELVEGSLELREEALRSELEKILLEERTRLSALGQTDAEVDRALERLKNGLDSDYEDRMEDFRARELGTYQSRIDTMKSERNNLMKALETAVEERKALAETLVRSESVLLATVYDQPDYSGSENTKVSADLEILGNIGRTQNYWLDELANQYLGLFDALSINNIEGAKSHIMALESMFSNEMISSLPGFDARNEADQEIVRFMSSYLSGQEGTDLENLLVETRNLIDLAESHAEEGRLFEASQSWERVEKLWPLMGEAIIGSRATRNISSAREIRRYANLADISLKSGDYESAALIWESGLERLPSPLGEEINQWGKSWNESESRRRTRISTGTTAMILEYEEKIDALNNETETMIAEHDARINRINSATIGKVLEYEEKLNLEATEKEVLRNQIIELNLEASQSETVNTMDQELMASLASAEIRIRDLELTIRTLEEKLAKNEIEEKTAEVVRPTTTQWRIYGTIVQIVGDTLVIEPMSDILPSVGSDVRIRRSLGGDRVIHLADGFLLEVNPARAVASISSSTSGAEVYGSPQVEDLVYIAVPVE